jgi:hypothetical protein
MCDPFLVKLAADGRVKWRCAHCGKDYETKVEAELAACKAGLGQPLGTPRGTQEPQSPEISDKAGVSGIGATVSELNRKYLLIDRKDKLEREIAYLEKASSSKYEIERKRDALNEVTKELTEMGFATNAGVERPETYPGGAPTTQYPASKIAEGQRIHYDFVKPHAALEGQTPAEAAGVGIHGQNKWLELLKASLTTDAGRVN